MLIEINRDFVNFYQRQGFQRLPRASLLDASIPMSFVMSAGLVQVEKTLAALGYRDGNKYVLVQDCFRHFDIDKVGCDDTHLSFFNMPGAFVFGEVDPLETVRAMWTLATEVLKLNPAHLWASYFNGGPVFDTEMPPDLQAREAWRSIGLPEEHIVGLPKEQNFWTQGNGFQLDNLVRKCGPNTELFYDRGVARTCGPNCKPGCACGRFVEFSNSLFIRFELDPASNSLLPIRLPFTETVIGSERIAMLREGVESVFETSAYRPLIQAIRQYLPGGLGAGVAQLSGERIIADHIRALYRLIADGAPPPGKDGRQRIIKILIRRIITQKLIMGISAPTFIPAIIDCAATQFPFTDGDPRVKEKLRNYIAAEEVRYRKTIRRGIDQIARLLDQNGQDSLTEAQILDLEQFWGLPQMLTHAYLQSTREVFESAALETA